VLHEDHMDAMTYEPYIMALDGKGNVKVKCDLCPLHFWTPNKRQPIAWLVHQNECCTRITWRP
jgi:hypothetical protein